MVVFLAQEWCFSQYPIGQLWRRDLGQERERFLRKLSTYVITPVKRGCQCNVKVDQN